MADDNPRRASAKGGPTVLSLFSGLGGLDLGLETAGFISVGCVEIDELAQRSLKANRGDGWPLLSPPDVTSLAASLRPKDLGLRRGEVSLVAGAPPCQPFSKAAQWSSTSRSGVADQRGRLILDLLRIVERVRPKIVLLENVSGFVRGQTSVLPLLEEVLPEINRNTGSTYELDWRILDAHDFGTPQRRHRAIIVLSRIGKFRWPDPDVPEARPSAWDAIGALPAPADTPTMTGRWADLLPSIPEGMNYNWHTSHGGGLPLFGYRRRYWSFLLKLAKDLPSWTLAAQPGPATGPFHWDSRPLTVAEMLRLQSLPADWVVEGSRVEQVRQIGNATPPALAERLGASLLELLGEKAPTTYVHSVQRSGKPPSPSRPGVVPPKYRELVGEHPDHPGPGKGPSPRTPAKGS